MNATERADSYQYEDPKRWFLTEAERDLAWRAAGSGPNWPPQRGSLEAEREALRYKLEFDRLNLDKAHQALEIYSKERDETAARLEAVERAVAKRGE